MKKNMIFFDIDGTLITEDKNRTLPKTTVEAIRKTRENGNLVFINTGRVFINIDKFIKNIGFDGYVCGCGTYIVFNDKILFHNRLSKELCREVAYKSREFKLCNLYEEAYYVGIDKDFSYNEDLKDLQNNLKINMFVGDEDFVFDKFCGWYDENSDIKGFKAYIQKYFEYIDRGKNFFEMQPKGFSKATGIEFLCKYFKIPLENCYAVGDSKNDLQMLSYVPHSIVMGESQKELFEIAEFITDTVLNDGIQKALMHYHLI